MLENLRRHFELATPLLVIPGWPAPREGGDPGLLDTVCDDHSLYPHLDNNLKAKSTVVDKRRAS